MPLVREYRFYGETHFFGGGRTMTLFRRMFRPATPMNPEAWSDWFAWHFVWATSYEITQRGNPRARSWAPFVSTQY